MPAIRAQIVKIGNSQGIRIPRAVLKQCQLKDEVWLEPAKEGLIVRPANQPRAGWENALQQMARAGDDALLDPESVQETEWEEDEWQWT